jgi:histidine triad (HIT) family protein
MTGPPFWPPGGGRHSRRRIFASAPPLACGAARAFDEDDDVYNHAPPDYLCPFCRNLTTGASDLPLEFIHRDDAILVKMNPKWWLRNPGSVLVIPNDHYENVYDLPVEFGTPIQRAVRSAAIAMKSAFGCDGVSTRQHNEPDGNQDVWHYHVHVFPRWKDDDLYGSSASLADADELRQRAGLLREFWPKA